MVKVLSIRLQRNKLYKTPQYKIVVMFSSNATSGAPLDIVGKFIPKYPQKMFFINIEKFAFWLQKGAVVSNTVVKLLGKLTVSWDKNKIIKIKPLSKRKKKRAKQKKKLVIFESAEDKILRNFKNRFEKKISNIIDVKLFVQLLKKRKFLRNKPKLLFRKNSLVKNKN